MIQLSLHPDQFKQKPSNQEAGIISLSIGKNKCSISEEQFKSALENGQAWCPGIFANGKRCKPNWLKQQLFVADIDNGNLAFEQITYLCDRECIEPFIVHESFSSKPDAKKWRVIFRTAEVITDANKATSIGLALAGIFNSDKSVAEVSRLLYGGNKPVAYFDKEAVLDIIELELEPITEKPKADTKALTQISEDWVTDQNAIFDILINEPRYEARLKLILLRLDEAKEQIQTIGEGSGYQSVFRSAIKLGQLKELISPYIVHYLTECVDDCDEYAYGTWQHRPKLEELIETGIRLGRNRLYD